MALASSLAVGQQTPTATAVRPVLTVEVHGKEVEYDQQTGALQVTGQATITIASDRPGLPTVSVAADRVDGSLGSGRLTASEGVKLLSQQFSLRGSHVALDFKRQEFALTEGAASVEMPAFGGGPGLLRAFFFGDKIGATGPILYVLHGRVTTCDREHPHYSIGSNKVTYNTATRVLTVYGGIIQFNSFRWRLPWRYSTRLGIPTTGRRPHPRFPGFSRYDGFYAPVQQRFTGVENDWDVEAEVRVGTELRFPAALTADRATERGLFSAELSRRQEVVWDLHNRSRLNRLPEISYRRRLGNLNDGLSTLDLTAYAGYLREHVDRLPVIAESRAGLELQYTPLPLQRERRQGWWWAATGRHTLYSTGDHLSDLALETGLGWNLGHEVALALSGTHHFTDGDSPFYFDDLWVEDELTGTLQTNRAREWSFGATGRWDLERGDLRDYSLQLSRRRHCLTWNLIYNFGSETIAVGLDLNGLTGQTPPPLAAPLVAPDEVPPLPTPVPLLPGQEPPFGL